MLKADKIDRVELYKDRNTQVFLSKFVSGEISELEPVYDPKLGYRFPTAEAVVGSASSAEAFLDKLYEAGILERRLYDKIIHCPKCGSASVSVHYCCPYCKSFNVQKSALIEHVKCGYMDVEENFHKANKLVCPKCHEELRKLDVDHRRAGIWCNCKECGKSFDIPVTANFCRDCHGNFTFEDVVIKDVYAYSLKAEAKEEAALGWVLIAPIREFLAENGFEVESPAFLKGKSGANHMFDIVAHDGETGKKVTVIDLATSAEGEVSEQPVIALFAKIFDVSPDKAYLIAIPKVNENGRKMAELYNIQIIEAKNQKEVIEVLKDRLLKKQ
jgi:transcription elongation factor Elf1